MIPIHLDGQKPLSDMDIERYIVGIRKGEPVTMQWSTQNHDWLDEMLGVGSVRTWRQVFGAGRFLGIEWWTSRATCQAQITHIGHIPTDIADEEFIEATLKPTSPLVYETGEWWRRLGAWLILHTFRRPKNEDHS